MDAPSEITPRAPKGQWWHAATAGGRLAVRTAAVGAVVAVVGGLVLNLVGRGQVGRLSLVALVTVLGVAAVVAAGLMSVRALTRGDRSPVVFAILPPAAFGLLLLVVEIVEVSR